MLKLYSPFIIKFDGLPDVVLSCVDVNEIIPHEEADQRVLEATRKYITKGRKIKDPIIVDKRTGVILDGTHRYAVAKELNIEKLPAACVDYNDYRIRVRGWVLSIVKSAPIIEELANQWEITGHPKQGRLTLFYRGEFYASNPGDAMELLRKAQEISHRIELEGGIVLRDAFPRRGITAIYLPYPSKSEIISNAMIHRLYPPKSTRHVVPGRPMNLNFPLGSNCEIRELIFRKSMRLLRPQSKIGKKVFEEEVLLFKRSPTMSYWHYGYDISVMKLCPSPSPYIRIHTIYEV